MTSKYFLSLTGDSRKRYLEKLSFIGGHDPLDTSLPGWGENPDHFPNLTCIDMVNYLVFGSAPLYTDIQFKNYKSLEAYDRFVCGWVQKIQTLTVGCETEKIVVSRSRVNHSQRLNQTPVACWLIIKENGNIVSCLAHVWLALESLGHMWQL